MMHEGECKVNNNLLKNLLTEQFPQWADLNIRLIQPEGTDNAMYYLGKDKIIRLPRIPSAAKNIDKEINWLPKLAPLLPIEIPKPMGFGEPNQMYPFHWYICQRIKGSNPDLNNPLDLEQAAIDLGQFVNAMRKISLKNGPRVKRGMPLRNMDVETRQAINQLSDLYDIKLLAKIWDETLSVPDWTGKDIWIHADLHAGNVLAFDGKITGIVDFGMMGVGDPSADCMPAWTLLSQGTRNIFKDIVNPDTATWLRGRGWAFCMGVVAYPYYKDTNPAFAALARKMIDEVIQSYGAK